MDNRDRDKLSHNNKSTDAGDVNRKTSGNLGKSQSGSSAEFGQNIGRSEKPESEPNRRSGNLDESSVPGDRSESSGMTGSSGRNPSGSMDKSGNSEH